MRQRLSEALVGLYGAAARTGVLDRPRPRRGFELAYDAYKGLAEAGPIGGLQRLVPPGATVIDVGANIGFFTLRFARWVGPGGRVIAIEPELRNVRSLRHRVERAGVSSLVSCVHAAATDRPGEVRLAVTSGHPADHHLSDAGVPVPAVTLDELASDTPPGRVALVKADVQGAETLVLRGARQLLETHRPAIFVEVDEPSLARLGSSAVELLDLIIDCGYGAHRLGRHGPGSAEPRSEVLARVEHGYGDALFLPDADLR